MGLFTMSKREFSRLDILLDLDGGRITATESHLCFAAGVRFQLRRHSALREEGLYPSGSNSERRAMSFRSECPLIIPNGQTDNLGLDPVADQSRPVTSNTISTTMRRPPRPKPPFR